MNVFWSLWPFTVVVVLWPVLKAAEFTLVDVGCEARVFRREMEAWRG